MVAKSLTQWLNWMESCHPKEIDLGLERVREVAQRLGLLHFACPVVTVAGTNGKGSSIAALEALYLDASYQVGTYTSPHLLFYNERVRINGQPVSDVALVEAFEAIDAARLNLSLTYFEFGTLAALYIFQRAEHFGAPRPLDLILLEVGLGGRLDAVNIIDADVALITGIDLDHQAYLGDTREQIGFEKAGIMRAGQSVVIGDPVPPQSLLQQAAKLGLTPILRNQHFSYEDNESSWRWKGENQQGQSIAFEQLPYGSLLRSNLAAALQVSQVLPLKVSENNIRHAMLVSVPGRQEYLAGQPAYLFDVSHNPQGVAALAEHLATRAVSGRVYALMGALSDKPLLALLQPLLSFVYEWHLAVLPVARSYDFKALTDALAHLEHAQAKVHGSVEDALQAVLSQAGPADLILVYGSFYTVAAVKRLRMLSASSGQGGGVTK